jgi:hypothetical protein
MNVEILEKNIEELAEAVHISWMDEKIIQGFHSTDECDTPRYCDRCHADLMPYSQLADNIKEYDRVTVRAVIDAISLLEEDSLSDECPLCM